MENNKEVTDTNVGNIEEDIKVLKNIEKLRRIEFKHYVTDREEQALKNILLYYTKQMQINEELRKKVKELEKYKQMYLDEVDKHVDTVLIYNSLLKRIENKIKESEKLIKEAEDDEEYSYEIPLYEHDIQLLQELLGESEDKQCYKE